MNEGNKGIQRIGKSGWVLVSRLYYIGDCHIGTYYGELFKRAEREE